MGTPNFMQQMYLAKALDRDTDHLFDHPLEEKSEETECTSGCKCGHCKGLKRITDNGKGKK
jgi:hypothetical protein